MNKYTPFIICSILALLTDYMYNINFNNQKIIGYILPIIAYFLIAFAWFFSNKISNKNNIYYIILLILFTLPLILVTSILYKKNNIKYHKNNVTNYIIQYLYILISLLAIIFSFLLSDIKSKLLIILFYVLCFFYGILISILTALNF